MTTMKSLTPRNHVTVVLHRPQFPENIGAAARAMCNMGLVNLRVVAPRNYDFSRVERLATHAAADVVNRIVIYDDIETALADMNYVVGTTARMGHRRQVILSPAQMAEKIVPIAETNRVGLLFGPEDRGLTNADIRYCHLLVNIPTSAFSSINLAHAVMILSYEIWKATMPERRPSSPKLAQRRELEAMYDQLQDILMRIHYIQPVNPAHWMDRFRRFFSRLPLRTHEVTIIRGICRQIEWYARKCYFDGKYGKNPDPALGIEKYDGGVKESSDEP
ncbi:MAG: RNA methyltransferase [Thermodesulfobacteriota bacterium]